MDRLERDRLDDRRGLGKLLAAHVRGDAADDLEQARSPGVDDARLPEHVELIRRPLERLLPVRDEIGEGVLERDVGRRELLRPFGERPADGEHRPLLRIGDGGVARVASRPQGAGERGDVHRAVGRERLHDAPDLLREDDARVPARAHQDRPAMLAPGSRSSASTTARTVSVMFVPVSPSGTG